MTTLYRKYRPQKFSDVADQEHIITTILNEVATNKVAHAYLFSGPRGVGKTTTARLLSKAVNCEKRKDAVGEPCNTCASCEEITVGRSIDVIEIDAASQTGVDNVRENIIENAQFKPTKSKYKVFIIDEVHMLSPNAFNALLKTLEEPPAHIIFILATTELHKLPATVVSRCQRFTFKKISYDHMLERLKKIVDEEKVKVDKEVLSRIIKKSEGGLRDAESLLGQILALGLKKVTASDIELILPTSSIESVLEFLQNICDYKTGSAIAQINDLYNEGTNIDQFAYDTIETLRVILVVGTTKDTSAFKAEYSGDTMKSLVKLGEAFDTNRLVYLIDRLLKRRLEIKTTPFPQLPLELFVVEATALPNDTPTNRPSNSAPTTPSTSPGTPVLASNAPKSTPRSTTKEMPEKTEASTLETATVNDIAAPLLTPNSSLHPIKTTLTTIKEKWSTIIEKISESNHSLTFILKMCGLKNLDARGLTLTVPYSFHKEKIEETKSRRVIEDHVESLCGERIPILCEVESAPVVMAETELATLASSFGGEVVG